MVEIGNLGFAVLTGSVLNAEFVLQSCRIENIENRMRIL
jgi:hypothetical protein